MVLGRAQSWSDATGSHIIGSSGEDSMRRHQNVSVGGYHGADMLDGLREELMVFRVCKICATNCCWWRYRTVTCHQCVHASGGVDFFLEYVKKETEEEINHLQALTCLFTPKEMAPRHEQRWLFWQSSTDAHLTINLTTYLKLSRHESMSWKRYTCVVT